MPVGARLRVRPPVRQDSATHSPSRTHAREVASKFSQSSPGPRDDQDACSSTMTSRLRSVTSASTTAPPSWSSCITTVALTVKSTRTLRGWGGRHKFGLPCHCEVLPACPLATCARPGTSPDLVGHDFALPTLKSQALNPLEGTYEFRERVRDSWHELEERLTVGQRRSSPGLHPAGCTWLADWAAAGDVL
jgi:hypothetical protein